MFRLYLVTDRHATSDLVDGVAAAVDAAPPGYLGVQLREKDLDGGDLFRLAESLRRVTERAGAPLLVNDRVDVALAVGADGVHLPGGGLSVAEVRAIFPRARVGVSTHAVTEVRRAAKDGADFVVFGPVYDSPSKRRYGRPLGLEALRVASGEAVAVLALGGVTPQRTPAVVAAGAAGVACIRAVLAQPKPGKAVAAFLAALGGTPGLLR